SVTQAPGSGSGPDFTDRRPRIQGPHRTAATKLPAVPVVADATTAVSSATSGGPPALARRWPHGDQSPSGAEAQHGILGNSGPAPRPTPDGSRKFRGGAVERQ